VSAAFSGTSSCANSVNYTAPVLCSYNCFSNNTYDVPNAFSLNGDGQNDEFCLKGWNGCMNSFEIKIYNRWGEKVYESIDPDFCWNGVYQGRLLDPAVFLYYIKATTTFSESITKKGNITLIR
jgi:gliding motility-associated-like protein